MFRSLLKTAFLTVTACLLFFTLRAQAIKAIRNLQGAEVQTGTMESAIKHIMDTARIVGLSVVIINNNKMIYRQTFGLKNKQTNSALNDTTEMYAASFTKPVSAYTFLKLTEKGIFNLDTPLYKYLKKPIAEYEKWKDLATDTAFRLVTPRMILSHSAGLPVLRFLYNNKVNLIALPGTRFYYSNEGMNLLGFAIEEYTGKKMEVLTKELVFDPLQMTHSALIWQPEFEKDYAVGYLMNGNPNGAEKRTSARAAGSMVTIASDYGKFVTALLQEQGLDKKLFKQLFTPQIKITSRKGFGPERDSMTNEYNAIQLSWGLGVGLFHSPYGQAFFHTGHSEGWQNYFVAYPQKKIAVIFMSNSSNFEHAADKLLQVTIGDTYSPLKWLGYFDGAE